MEEVRSVSVGQIISQIIMELSVEDVSIDYSIQWLVGRLVYGVYYCHFQQYLSYFVVATFIGGGNGENHRPVASH